MNRYSDTEYEYRHVQLPKAMLKVIPRDYFDQAKGTLKLLWEDEWRGLGITQVRSFLDIYYMERADPSRVSDGNTMRCTSQSLISCSSSKALCFP